MALNILPNRVAIGSAVDSNGKTVDVYMTPEFSRMLAGILERVGGETGTSTSDVEDLILQAVSVTPTEDPTFMSDTSTDSAALITAQLNEVRQQLYDLQQRYTELASSVNGGDSYVDVVDGSRLVDWERPGKIGRATPNSGAFLGLTSGAYVATTANLTRTAKISGASGGLGIYGYYDATNGVIMEARNTALTAYIPINIQGISVALYAPNGVTATNAFGYNGKLGEAIQVAPAAAVDLATSITAINNIITRLKALGTYT